MFASIASQQGARERANEDWAGASLNSVVLLDGLSSAPNTKSGCRHGTPWFVSRLGSRLLEIVSSDETDLKRALAVAIADVVAMHPECDAEHPGSPSATVAILRKTSRRQEVEFLVLADARVIIETGDGIEFHTDDRVDIVSEPQQAEALRHPVGSTEQRQAVSDLIASQKPKRNAEGGYWIAGGTPRAAGQAVTGAYPVAAVSRAALLSDGASRLVDTFDKATWQEALDLMQRRGPDELIEAVRALERSDPEGTRWPRLKSADDATAAFVRWP